MLLYILAVIGAITVLTALFLIGFTVINRRLGEPVTYRAEGHELQRFVSSWGKALADGGSILIREPKTGRCVHFIKRDYKKRDDRLLLRWRNADENRQYLEDVKSTLSQASIEFDVELTPRGRCRAVVVPFLLRDSLMPSAAAHAARLVLTATGAANEGPYELQCQGTHSADYVPGSVEVIPWTKGYRSGVRLGHRLRRFFLGDYGDR